MAKINFCGADVFQMTPSLKCGACIERPFIH
jgi:hypothetical protein